MTRQTKAIYRLTAVAMCVAIITLCAWISIPFSVAVTMQSFAIFLIAGLFPIYISLPASILYIFLGAIGVPVFAGFNAGAGVFIGASGGFLMSFPIVVLLLSMLRKHYSTNNAIYLILMILGLLMCYVCGLLWYKFMFQPNMSLQAAFTVCILPFIIPDVIKILLVTIVFKKLYPYTKKLPI